jgi:hypothetical protein
VNVETTNEFPGNDEDGSTILFYDHNGDPITRNDWVEIIAYVGERARAHGLELEISEDSITGEILYRVKHPD